MAALFDGLTFPRRTPRYNIAPTQNVLCVRQNKDGNNECVDLRWGLVPSWAKDLKMGARMINARCETVAEKPSFRTAFKKRRCLVMADGFYEWKKQADGKQPYYITRKDDQPFGMAGLWEAWRDKAADDAPWIETCTIITTSANTLMQTLHDRMPVIFEPDQFDMWLDKDFSERQPLEQMLIPFANDELQAVPVSRIVNNAGNESPECIKPLS
jgi:putative SOS response-associated peptidase YedK